jgi:hypothetical protein
MIPNKNSAIHHLNFFLLFQTENMEHFEMCARLGILDRGIEVYFESKH